MRTVHHDNLFRWTLTGRPYWLAVSAGVAVLILLMGVM